jgi:uncharacterized lipoprotein YmbA
MTMTARLEWCAGLLALSLLGGCAGSATRFYTVEATPPVQPAVGASSGPALRVDAVHIPPALDRTELIRNGEGGQVAVSDNDHWVAPVGELIRRALTQDLVERMPAGVVIFPDAPKPSTAQGLVVDILALTNEDGSLVMEASWTLVAAQPTSSSGTVPQHRLHIVRLSTSVAGPGVTGQAAAVSRLVGQLADKVAKGSD